MRNSIRAIIAGLATTAAAVLTTPLALAAGSGGFGGVGALPSGGIGAVHGAPAGVRPSGVGGRPSVGAFHGAPAGIQPGFGGVGGRPSSGFGAFHRAPLVVQPGFSGVTARPSGAFGAFHGAPVVVQPGFSGVTARPSGAFDAFHGAAGVEPSGGVGGVGIGARHGPGAGAWRSAAVGGSHHDRWRSAYWRNGRWRKGWWGPGFAAGVVVATSPNYNDCWVYEPQYDAVGNYLGQQYVYACR